MNSPAPLPIPRVLAWCLHLLVFGLLALAAVQAGDGGARATASIAAAVGCGFVYALGPAVPGIRGSRRAAAVWLGATCAAWLVLLALTAGGVWLAFPLYFLQLHLLPRRAALAAVTATAAAAITAFAVHQGSFAAAMVIGPVLGAAVAVAVVWGYQALYRESERRRALIEELTATRAELAALEHTAGILAERERLAGEIHDTLAQGFSSIQLLLRAAERALPDQPGSAAGHVLAARLAAADNLAEARRFVAALVPPSLEGTTLADALERLCRNTTARHAITVRFAVTGEPAALPTRYEVALLRCAQSALANTLRHAEADAATITLGFQAASVTLRVSDDGIGFDPEKLPAPDPELGGYGLAAMRARIRTLGGTVDIETGAGLGTAITARLPLPADVEADR